MRGGQITFGCFEKEEQEISTGSREVRGLKELRQRHMEQGGTTTPFLCEPPCLGIEVGNSLLY